MRSLGKALLARAGWIAAVLALPLSAQTEPVAPPSKAPPAAVVAQVRELSIAFDPATPPRGAEAAALSSIVRGARVIAFGENNHGNREPLEYRNRLIRYLVTHEGLTAVALESGLTESKGLYDYVLGKPGDLGPLVQTGLTHGFGYLDANRELVAWLRAYNADHPGRPVHLYGIDASTIQSAPPGATGYGQILQWLGRYLTSIDPARSAPLRARLKAFEGRFNEVDYKRWSAADQAAATRTLADVERFLRMRRAVLERASGHDTYDWAVRIAKDAADLPTMFAAWTDDPSQLDRLRNLVDLRDRTMASHTLWALQREGPRGKVLLFQTNGHISADTLVGSVMRLFPQQPALTGNVLRQRLGIAYRPIGTISSRGRGADDSSLGSVDRAFAAAGKPVALLDLHAPGLSPWWGTLQSASQGPARVDDFVPQRAFDALVYFDTLTPVPPPPRPK